MDEKNITVNPLYEIKPGVFESSIRETNPYKLRKKVTLSFSETGDGVFESCVRTQKDRYERKNKVYLGFEEGENNNLISTGILNKEPEEEFDIVFDESEEELSEEEKLASYLAAKESESEYVSPDISLKDLIADGDILIKDYEDYTTQVEFQSTDEQNKIREEYEPYAENVSIADDTVIIDVGKKKKRGRFGAWIKNHLPTKRRLMQVYTALLFNANLKGYIQGIYTTGAGNVSKGVICSPGINCYSCPGAIGTCPLGALQQQLGNKSFPFYIFGILFLYGIMFGRTICGWICPFGLIQDLVHKIKTPKVRKSSVTRALSYLKYVILALFVFILSGFGIFPAFCKYICPVGILEGAFGNVYLNEFALLDQLGSLFTWKFSIFILILVACIFVYRAFCRFICPLGAIYSLFNRISLFGIKLNRDKCTECGKCISKCKLDIKHVGDHECISCGECIDVCPTKAISFKGTKVLLAPSEINIPKDMPLEEKEKAEAKHNSREKGKKVVRIVSAVLVSVILAFVLLGAFVYYNIIDNKPLWDFILGRESGYEYQVDEGTNVGDKLPSMSLPVFDENGLLVDENGNSIIADPTQNEGKIVIINFWGIWCKPCLEELPHFNEIASEYSNDVVVYAIHYNDSFNKGVDKVKSEYSDSDMVFLKDTVDSEYYNMATGASLGAYPWTIVLNKEGIITYTSGKTLSKAELVTLINEAKK